MTFISYRIHTLALSTRCRRGPANAFSLIDSVELEFKPPKFTTRTMIPHRTPQRPTCSFSKRERLNGYLALRLSRLLGLIIIESIKPQPIRPTSFSYPITNSISVTSKFYLESSSDISISIPFSNNHPHAQHNWAIVSECTYDVVPLQMNAETH